MSKAIKKVGIFGTGKVALSIGYHLKKKDYEIGYCGRNLSAAQRYIDDIEALTFVSVDDLLDWCDVIGFVVTDSAIAEVSKSLSRKDKYAFHMSGALAADEIKGEFSELFSLHPLRAFAKVEPDLSDTTFALEIYKGHCSPEIDRFAGEFGRVIHIRPEHKVLYHASAVIASNLIVPVMDAANEILRQIGIDDETVLWPLIDSAITNMKTLGIKNALTGPVARGDGAVVKKHVDTLSAMSEESKSFEQHVSQDVSQGDISELYALLSRRALVLSRASESKKREILALLQKGGEQ
ncbi:MAG: DUF2520 domain-containing protein [Bacillota bacterium]|nr:DUF2520 domain-containing protein [Bacillota bacterium]